MDIALQKLKPSEVEIILINDTILSIDRSRSVWSEGSRERAEEPGHEIILTVKIADDMKIVLSDGFVTCIAGLNDFACIIKMRIVGSDDSNDFRLNLIASASYKF